MPNARADRDLLFGILALQNNFISREQLLSAFDSWVVNKERSIGKVLLAQKALTDDEHALLDGLANKHIARHRRRLVSPAIVTPEQLLEINP